MGFKGKYVVLFFYPLDFTFVCPTEIIAFSEAAAQFKKINCEVIAASTDSVFSHLAWTNTDRKQGGLGEMKIPILADTNHAVSKAYDASKKMKALLSVVFILLMEKVFFVKSQSTICQLVDLLKKHFDWFKLSNSLMNMEKFVQLDGSQARTQ